jgi:hypothetical protein
MIDQTLSIGASIKIDDETENTPFSTRGGRFELEADIELSTACEGGRLGPW